jgi:hypothetical protein
MSSVFPAPIDTPATDEAAELAEALRAHDKLLSGNALPPLPAISRCPGGPAGDGWVKLVTAWLARQGHAEQTRAALAAGLREAHRAVDRLYNDAENNLDNLSAWLREANDRCVRPAGLIRVGDIPPAARVEVESDPYATTNAFDLARGIRRPAKAVGVNLDRLAPDNRALVELRQVQPVPTQTDTAWSHKRESVVWLFVQRSGQADPLYVSTAEASVLTAAARRNELVAALA